MTAIIETERPLSSADRKQSVFAACLNLGDEMTHDEVIAVSQTIQDAAKPLGDELFAYLHDTFIPIVWDYQTHIEDKGELGSEDIEARAKAQNRFEREKLNLRKMFRRFHKDK